MAKSDKCVLKKAVAELIVLKRERDTRHRQITEKNEIRDNRKYQKIQHFILLSVAFQFTEKRRFCLRFHNDTFVNFSSRRESFLTRTLCKTFRLFLPLCLYRIANF